MRILVTTDTVGGVWNYAVTLVRALIDAGDECMLAMIGEPPTDATEALPPSVDTAAAPWRLEWLPDATDEDIEGAADWLRRLVADWGPDLIHVNQLAYTAAPLGAPTLAVAHSDVCSWFREVRDTEPGPEWSRYREWVRRGLRGADCVVAPTCYQSGMLARHYGQAADRVIHNGARPPLSAPRARASQRPLIATAGRAWDEAKGMRVLDEALERLGDRAPSAHLAGSLEGPAGERFTPRVLNAHGRLSPGAMERLYDNAAIYVAMSLYEPFGLAPLEAAGHGCALVLSDIGSFRELWHDAAVFVPPDSPGALAAALDDLLGDPARMDAFGAAARSRARDRYTEDSMVEQYRALYRRLVGDRAEKGQRTA